MLSAIFPPRCFACRLQRAVNRPRVEVSRRAISRNSMAGFRGPPRRGPSIALTIDLYSTVVLSHGNNGEHASSESSAISMGPFRPIRFESIGFSLTIASGYFCFRANKRRQLCFHERRRKGMERRETLSTPLSHPRSFEACYLLT